LGPELSYLLRDRKAALTCSVGDWQTMAEQLIRLAHNRNLRDEMARTAYHFAAGDLSFANTTRAVRSWAQHPNLAPDKQNQSLPAKIRQVEYRLRSVLRLALWRVAATE
jgi:hypothetical protein